MRLETWTSQNMCCVTSSTYFLTMNHTTGSCDRFFLRVHTLADLSTGYVQVGIEYTYGQANMQKKYIYIHYIFQLKSKLHYPGIRSSPARPPRLQYYHPVVVSCGRHVSAFSFSQEIIRPLCNKIFYFFNFLKTASTWNCVRQRVSVYMYIRHHVNILCTAYVRMLARAFVWDNTKCLEGLVEFKCALWTETFWKLHQPNCLLTFVVEPAGRLDHEHSTTVTTIRR
jgi:hypothetical protein